MKKEEREALKKLEQVMAKRLDIMLTLTETMVNLCESEERALAGLKILTRLPEGDEHEPEPEKPLDDEEYDGYVEYTKFIEQPENRRVLKGRIKHIERNPPTIGLDEIDEPDLVKYEENLHPEEESGWIG